jgi:YHS domain-containing protein
VLNLMFLGLFGMLYWLYRSRDRLGGGAGLAIDPVCGMQVRTADAPARGSFAGQPFWFCSDRCRERFDADPARYGVAYDATARGGSDDRRTV